MSPKQKSVAVAMAVLAASFPCRVAFAQAQPPTYQEMVAYFNRIEIHADTVMVGDSITGGWHEQLPTAKSVNRAIAGDTTSGVLARLDGIYKVHAKRAFVMIGVNDFSGGSAVDDVYARYVRIVDALEQHGMQVTIQSTLLCNEDIPRMSGGGCRAINAKIRDLNARLRGLCAARHLAYLDVNAVLSDEHGLRREFTDDGLHPNKSGYAAWAPLLVGAGRSTAE